MVEAVFDADRPLRVGALFSGGASGVRYLIDHATGHGEAYEVVAGFGTDPDATGVEALRERGVPVESRDVRGFHRERGDHPRDLTVRPEYDRRTREAFDEYDPDVLLLSGYMWVVTDPLLSAYPVINVHPADLAVREDGERRYVGADAVYDAVTAGEPQTRSTVHFVTRAVDDGPILVRSEPFEVHRELVATLRTYGAADPLRSYVDAQQEWMKWAGDGPAIATALELIAAGRVERAGGLVRIDGEPGFYDLEVGDVVSPSRR